MRPIPKRSIFLASFFLTATIANAQYLPPVKLPGASCPEGGNLQRVIGLAVDAPGGEPYPAAFLLDHVTDGTVAGTRWIENLPNSVDSDIFAIPGGIGGYMIGSGKTLAEFDQLFHTDGSDSGTHIVDELLGYIPEGIRKIHGFLQQSIVLETQTSRLVVSDGTLAGTYTLLPGGGGEVHIYKVSFGLTQGFVHAGDAQGMHIWRFGASLADKRDLTPDVPPPFYTADLTAFGDRACFPAGQNVVGSFSGMGLYCTDGTVEGTALVPTGNDGAPFGVNSESGFQRFGTKLFFVALWKPSPESLELYLSPWATDGTIEGTEHLIPNSILDWNRIGTASGRVFFTAYHQASGFPFWISDGSGSGTSELSPTPWSIALSYDTDIVNPEFGSAAFFVSAQGKGMVSERQIQRTDGSATGTFPMPPPSSIPLADWRPSVDLKPALLEHYLLACNSDGMWSYDLDPLFEDAFD